MHADPTDNRERLMKDLKTFWRDAWTTNSMLDLIACILCIMITLLELSYANLRMPVVYSSRYAFYVWDKRRTPIPALKCPHGYEDWDACPDCCH